MTRALRLKAAGKTSFEASVDGSACVVRGVVSIRKRGSGIETVMSLDANWKDPVAHDIRRRLIAMLGTVVVESEGQIKRPETTSVIDRKIPNALKKI